MDKLVCMSAANDAGHGVRGDTGILWRLATQFAQTGIFCTIRGVGKTKAGGPLVTILHGHRYNFKAVRSEKMMG